MPIIAAKPRIPIPPTDFRVTVSLDAVCAVAYEPGREKLSAFSYLYLDDFCDMLLGAQMKIVLTTGRLRMS